MPEEEDRKKILAFGILTTMLFSCTARSWPHSMEKLKNKTVLADLAPLECIPRRISSSSLASFGAYAPPKPSWGESIVPRWQNIRWNLIFYIVHEILKKQNICLWSHCALCICRCFLASFEPLVIFVRASYVCGCTGRTLSCYFVKQILSSDFYFPLTAPVVV